MVLNKIVIGCIVIFMMIATATADEGLIRLIDDQIPDSKPDWNVENNLIVFQSDRGESADIWTMAPDGSDLKQLTTDLSLDLYASWKPDGSMVTYYSDRTGNSEIWVMSADGTDQKQITDNSYWDGNPAWGPDGRIAFSSTRTGYLKIWIMEPDGSSQTQLTTGDSNEDVASWSPDARYIAFVSTRSGDRQLWKIDVNTKEYSLLDPDVHYDRAPSDNVCPNLMSTSWSPDGTKIAYHSYKSGSSAIWLMDADGSNQKMVFDGEGADYYSPTWSPDGTMIAFQEKILGSETGESNICILDLTTTSVIPQKSGLFSLIAIILAGFILHRRD